MRPSIFIGAFLPLALACADLKKDACLRGLRAAGSSGEAFCAIYISTVHKEITGLPAFAAACDNKPQRISSACGCTPPKTFKKVIGKPAKTATSKGAHPTKPADAPAKPSKAPAVTYAPNPPVKPAPGPQGCTATAYSQIAGIVAKCKNIVLQDIEVPANSQLLLDKLLPGTSVTFAGKTTFGFTPDSDFDPIVISGNGITVTGAPGHVIDGNGSLYWDGLGSNGGCPKPDHFIVVKKMTNSVFTNLNIKNWPVHCFSVTGSQNLKFTGLHLNNADGNAPNSRSRGLPAAHNSDGFDFSSNIGIILSDTFVSNQDDCVAVTSGTNTLITGLTCIGGHGLSIGSVGGKSNNVVDGVTFSNSTISNSENGCRIKSNSGTTGSITNVLYKNIKLSNISKYGIDLQQDYLNGGPTGKPTNGVKIQGVVFEGVTGMVGSGAYNYYILCGAGSCSDVRFVGTQVTGGKTSSNFAADGFPA